MIYDNLEGKGPPLYSYDKLVEVWKNSEQLPDSHAFHGAMALLAETRKDLFGWQDRAKRLESSLDDYKSREQTFDVMTLRSEVRALQTRVISLETSLKLLNHTD